MKNTILAGLIFLGAVSASAQVTETYCSTIDDQGSPNLLALLDANRVIHNTRTCRAAGLPDDCTQAQARAVPGNEQARIFADSEAGRELYVRVILLAPRITELENDKRRWDRSQATPWDQLSQTVRDQICVARGLTAGCVLP